MEPISVALTPVDRIVLGVYKSTMEGLADYLGEGYEFVLHSLEDLDHSVIKIINGHHTGRKEGAPITDLALNMLSAIEQNGGNDYISYPTQNRQGEPLRATTIAIRGEEGRVIALLCINFYLNTPLSRIMETWFPVPSNGPVVVQEHFAEDSVELTDKLIDDAVSQVTADPTIPAGSRNKRIVALLHERGIFKIKSSVDVTARRLNISRNTVYLHLRACKGKPTTR